MIRASWMAALFGALASAGVAWPEPPARPAERIVTVRQSDSLPESCRIKKAWTTAGGHRAWLVQSLASDMLLTVVAKDRGPAGAKLVGVLIYPWGNDSAPPKGSPAPPPDEDILLTAFTKEVPRPQLPAAPVVPASHVAPAPVVTPAAGCATGHCDTAGPPCDAVHRCEMPPTLHFVQGGCLPVCGPEHSANYGYYPTQWRPYPRPAEVTPAAAAPARPEPLPEPKDIFP